MKQLRLGAQLNISFGLVLFVPLLIATVFSIVYYSQKIEDEAVNTVSADLKMSHIIYQNQVSRMRQLAGAYTQKKIINFLIGFSLGEKIGADWAKSASEDNIDMITIVDRRSMVLVRSHAPNQINDIYPSKLYIQKALIGMSFSGTEVLTVEELEKEGLKINFEAVGSPSGVMAVTGVAPVFDRQRENIVAALIVRRILNRDDAYIEEMREKTGADAAIFGQTSLIAGGDGAGFILPKREVLEKVISERTEHHEVRMSKDGGISKFLPINDFSGMPVGVLMVQISADPYIRTRNTAILTLLIIFATGCVLAFIVKTIVERRILVPVQRLKGGVSRIGGGEYDHKLEVTSGDEIGDLTSAFNQMAGDLHQYDIRLKEYNQQLEERVKERTAELEIANEQLTEANTALEETLETLYPGVSMLIQKNRQQLGLVFGTELVADVCNYTKLNMILGETMMGEFMKLFFRESHRLLAQYRGMFDKTVGDQIVAIFGTPKDMTPASSTHPFDAIACAQKLVGATEDINRILQEAIQDNYTAIAARHKALSKEDRESIRIEDLRFQCRIGINTSNPASDREIDRMRMVMMGAETCVDYTAQGGSVIYAFRLENTGTPGEIHIGENTRRLTDHVFILEEMPAITLKGLGTQTRCRVTGYQSVLENIYPKTRFYRNYFDRLPPLLMHLIEDLTVGRMQIREVKKIREFLDVDIPYLEHLAGYYNYCLTRGLLAHAVGAETGMDSKTLNAMVFASVCCNALSLKEASISDMEIYPAGRILPEGVSRPLADALLADLEAGEPALEATKIIRLCNRFAHMVFDRTLLKNRSREIISVKEALSLFKIEGKYDENHIRIMEELMFVREDESIIVPKSKRIYLPSDPEQMAEALERILNPADRLKLLERLGDAQAEADGGKQQDGEQ